MDEILFGKVYYLQLATMGHYKLRQLILLQLVATSSYILQIATGMLLQFATSFLANCDRYYKLRRPLLQIATGVTNYGVITNCTD